MCVRTMTLVLISMIKRYIVGCVADLRNQLIVVLPYDGTK